MGPLMTPASGNTTVTSAPPARPARDGRELALVWLHPERRQSLLVANEGDATEGTGTWLIGREPGVAIHLSGSEVSRGHARLRREGPQAPWVLTDLGSRNGTYVNGQTISTASLVEGDVLRIGGWVGMLTSSLGPFAELAPGLWGGATLQEALRSLKQAAPSDLPIVLQGETGTGKEVVARTLHAWSRRGGPLVAMNTAALPESLAEAELFGYRKGAFTGADRASEGLFRSAHTGTLFLDEIGDMPLPLQAKLLRVLEERAVQPLGEARTVAVDVRVVVASQSPLENGVRDQTFRADVLARLDGLTVRLPPLRQRREDVWPLFCSLLQSLCPDWKPTADGEFVERLCLYDWPFNVRELVFLVRQLHALHAAESSLAVRHLPDRMINRRVGASTSPPDGPKSTQSQTTTSPPELPALLAALRASEGNVARASALLGISRQRAYRLMESHAIDLEKLRTNPGGR